MKVYAGNRFRHVKSGHLYQVLTMALQEEDLEIQVVYQRADMGSDVEPPVWVRPAREFFDGRFVMLPGAQEKMTSVFIPSASPEADRQLAEMLDREGRAREADIMAMTEAKGMLDHRIWPATAKAERGKKPTGGLWDSAGNLIELNDKVRRTDGSPIHYLVAGFDSAGRQVLCAESDTSTLWWPAKELLKVDDAGKTD